MSGDKITEDGVEAVENEVEIPLIGVKLPRDVVPWLVAGLAAMLFMGWFFLRQLPNVWFDTASIPAYLAEEGFPYTSGVPILRAALDRIGAGRIMWGSDIPGLLAHATYAQLRAAAEFHTAALPEADRRKIMGETAVAVFSL